MVHNLAKLTPILQDWNRSVFGHIIGRKKEFLARIRGIQRSLQYGHNPFLDKLEYRLNKDIEEVLNQEKPLWFEKSRRQWINEGDRNTCYYHVKVITRR